MNALLIDPTAKTVTTVAVDRQNTLQALYALIGCARVEVVSPNPAMHLYVDEEPTTTHRFAYPGLSYSVAGRAVVVGPVATDGSDSAATVTAAEVAAAIIWA